MQRVARLFFFGCALLAGGGSTALGLEVLPHSFSRSKQFVIYAQDAALRGAVGDLAEDTKTQLLSTLGLRDDWQTPIVIGLRLPEPAAPGSVAPVRMTLGQTGSGLKIELDLLIGEVTGGTRIRDELVRALLLELAYRQETRLLPGQPYNPPPDWLVEGLSAYVQNIEDGVTANMFAALLPTAQKLSIAEFLSRDPATMDSTSRAVYRADSYNLVCLLLREMQNGRDGLVAYVRTLPKAAAADARSATALAANFPEIASAESLEKWWTLGLARLAAADRFQVLSVSETEERLQRATTFSVEADANHNRPAKTYTLTDFHEFTPLKHNRQWLEGTREALAALGGQANPLYAQIIVGYQDVVAGMIRGHTDGIGEKLAALDVQRRDVGKCRVDIADYMNWYEATQVPTQSGSFNEYFRAARQSNAVGSVHRPDAISVYLDGLGAEIP